MRSGCKITSTFHENVLREQQGYSYKLRDVDLPDPWLNAIETCFVEKEQVVEISINLDMVESLHQESAIVREMFIVEEDENAALDFTEAQVSYISSHTNCQRSTILL